MLGKILREGSFYVALTIDKIKLSDSFRTRSQAIQALYQHNESVHNAKLNLIKIKEEAKQQVAKELAIVQAEVAERKKIRLAKRNKNKSNQESN